MGSGYISHALPAYLGMSECHDHKWLLYKAEELQPIEAKTPFFRSPKVIKWRSESGPIWEPYRDMFYRDNKKSVTMETLDLFRAIGLAIWYGDKGFWYSNCRAGLRTTAFGDSNHTIAQYFNEIGFACEIKQDSHNAQRIVFTREGTIKFLTTIIQRLPQGFSIFVGSPSIFRS